MTHQQINRHQTIYGSIFRLREDVTNIGCRLYGRSNIISADLFYNVD